MLRRFTEKPSRDRWWPIMVVISSILAIGWVDASTGTRMSFIVFYLVPVSLATVWRGRAGGVSAALASVVMRFVADSADDEATLHEAWLWWNSFGSLFVYFAHIWVLDTLVQLHRQLEERVRERTAALQREVGKRQEIQRELLELSGRERSAMGRELHDQLGQHLVGTAMAAQVLAENLHGLGQHGAREARQIADLVEQGIAQTRQLAQGLLLSHIEPARLRFELEELCATLRQQYPGIECDCRIDEQAVVPDGHAAAQIYRLAQEALRNAFRHSQGHSVWLRFTQRAPGVLLVIEDDGRGLPAHRSGSGMGLRIMQHRAEHIGARLELTARHGGGTRVACLVPLPSTSRLQT